MITTTVLEYWQSNEDRPKMRLAVAALLASVLFLLLRFLLALVGWFFGSGEVRQYEVSGNVSVVGQPLDTGTITFFPSSDKGRAAVARINSEGSYTTRMQSGNYKVVVDASQTTYRDYPDIEKDPDSGKGLPELDFLVPDEYLDMKTTPLSIDIDSSSVIKNITIPSHNEKTVLRQRLTEMLATKSAKVFVEKSGKIIGPSSLSKVLSALNKGSFTLDDKVSDSEDGPWLPILRSPLFLVNDGKQK